MTGTTVVTMTVARATNKTAVSTTTTSTTASVLDRVVASRGAPAATGDEGEYRAYMTEERRS